MSVTDTLRTWTVMETIIAVLALVFIVLLDVFV
jgi:H+/gluconate symporter-like permease